MKLKVLRNVLESALSRCYYASEKRSSDSIVKFSFDNNTLNLHSRGALVSYCESCPILEIDEECDHFYLYTSTVLEFIKHASTDEIIIAKKDDKTCIFSTTDKKQKIALQTVETTDSPENETKYISSLSGDFLDIINRMHNASKFCSQDFQQHPLNAIHINFESDKLTIQSANGPMFYKHECNIELKTFNMPSYEMYIPRKTPSIIRNIFSDLTINSIKFSDKTIFFEAENASLILYIESNEQNIFPNKVLAWLTKEKTARIKISHFEIAKTVRFFNGIFDNPVISFNIANDELAIESTQDKESSAKDTGIAAKEYVAVEECEGTAKSSYNSRYILDCLEAISAPWLNIDFIVMQNSYCIARITHGGTLILLCPTTS